MNKMHAIALAAASAAFLGMSSSTVAAQNVSDGDSYQQGYAAGASAKEQNNLNSYDSGYKAGQAAQTNIESQVAGTQAYSNGYQAGLAQAQRDREEAYNEGYQDRAQSDRTMTARAYDNSDDARAYRRAWDEAEYP
jgi:hypothetical protein